MRSTRGSHSSEWRRRVDGGRKSCILYHGFEVMGMNIKNERVERLARQLAEATGQSLTGAVETALERELHRLRMGDDYAIRKARIKEILKRSGPTPPGVTSDHSDLYDDDGLPA